MLQTFKHWSETSISNLPDWQSVPFQPAAHSPGQAPLSLAQTCCFAQWHSLSQLLPKNPSSHSTHHTDTVQFQPEQHSADCIPLTRLEQAKHCDLGLLFTFWIHNTINIIPTRQAHKLYTHNMLPNEMQLQHHDLVFLSKIWLKSTVLSPFCCHTCRALFSTLSAIMCQ